MRQRTFTDLELINAVEKSVSIREVLVILKLSSQGGNYHTVNKHIVRLQLDTSHFTGKHHRKGNNKPKRSIESYFDNQISIGSDRLRRRILKEGLMDHRCTRCLNVEWLGAPIPLELDHIDGNNQNNNFGNLRLLCPNCHAGTSTYRGKNKKKVMV